MKSTAWKPGNAPAAEAPAFAEVTAEDLAAAYRRVLERRAGAIVAVCVRCQGVIYAQDVKVRTRPGWVHAHHVNGPFRTPQQGADDEQH